MPARLQIGIRDHLAAGAGIVPGKSPRTVRSANGRRARRRRQRLVERRQRIGGRSSGALRLGRLRFSSIFSKHQGTSPFQLIHGTSIGIRKLYEAPFVSDLEHQSVRLRDGVEKLNRCGCSDLVGEPSRDAPGDRGEHTWAVPDREPTFLIIQQCSWPLHTQLQNHLVQ